MEVSGTIMNCMVENILVGLNGYIVTMKAVHKRDISKHSLAREPSLRNHKNKNIF